MALFDEIYGHKNTMQAIEDTEVAEAFEEIGKDKKKSMFDEKSKKRQRAINALVQAAKYIEDSDIDPDTVSIKISIGEDYKIKFKGKRFWRC